MNDFIKTYGKAISTFFGTLGGSLGTAMLDGNLTGSEVLVCVGTTMVFTFTTYHASYRPTEGT